MRRGGGQGGGRVGAPRCPPLQQGAERVLLQPKAEPEHGELPGSRFPWGRKSIGMLQMLCHSVAARVKRKIFFKSKDLHLFNHKR